MSLSRRPSLLLLAVLLAGVSAAAIAAPQHGRQAPQPDQQQAQQDQDGDRTARDRGSQRGDDALSDSVRRIERNTRGQVLSAERVPYDGRSLNRIKIIDDRGRVRVYMDDPQAQKRPSPPTHDDDD